MEIVLGILKTLFLLGILVIVHEGGHFLVAKLCKVRVNEFSVGFGKILWSKQGKETKYSLRIIPLGGYVSLEGEEEHSDEEGSFSKANIWKKIAIVSAGAIVNILFGLLVYFLLVTYHYGFEIALSSTGNFARSLAESIKTLFTGGTTIDDLTGPVGIANIVSKTSDMTDFIYLLSVISLSLGVTNLLPIPPLDRRKTFNIYNRMDKEKASKRTNITKNTNIRICIYNWTFTLCAL